MNSQLIFPTNSSLYRCTDFRFVNNKPDKYEYNVTTNRIIAPFIPLQATKTKPAIASRMYLTFEGIK